MLLARSRLFRFSRCYSIKTQPVEAPKPLPSGAFYEKLVENQRKYGQHLLMARVGDFYEFYFDQAQQVARLLNLKIARTQYRGKEVQFCGFPVFKMKDYVRLLMDQGCSVAKYEQYEKIQRNNEKLLIRRVDRIFTPGTVTEEDYLDGDMNSRFVMAVYPQENQVGFSCIDLSTGTFFVDSCANEQLKHKVSSILPAEILLPESALSDNEGVLFGLTTEYATRKVPDALFSADLAGQYLASLNSVSTSKQVVSKPAFRLDANEVSRRSAGALLHYLIDSHDGVLPLLDMPGPFRRDIVEIDAETQRSLELTSRMRGKGKKDSLLNVLDNTLTPLGGKELASRLAAPFSSVQLINTHLDLVEAFKAQSSLRAQVKNNLATYFNHDFGRAVQNLKLSHGGIWHLGVVYNSLVGFSRLNPLLNSNDFKRVFEKQNIFEGSSFAKIVSQMNELSDLLENVLPRDFISGEATLSTLPKTIQEPGMISLECHPQLKEAAIEYQRVQDRRKELVNSIKQKYFPGIDGVTVTLSYRKPMSAFVEVECPRDVQHNLDLNFMHLQTLGGQGRVVKRRYRFNEWTDLYALISISYDNYLQTERKTFLFVCNLLYRHREALMKISKLVAVIDVACCFADLAEKLNYVRPKIVDNPVLNIVSGRHPVVELSLLKEQKHFVPNSCNLDVERGAMIILTGSNMGGKSTFLRQNALIAVMSHIGCFVPAKKATIGRIDKLFSRIGTSDDVSRHQSSFMVEMLETSFILRQATSQSLVLMDEVGRGTSYKDGTAIAYGVVKHLDKINCRTIFATHFDKVAEVVGEELEGPRCMNMLIEEKKDGTPMFTYKVGEGVCHQVYGLFVAKLAGVPYSVVKDAELFQSRF